jgi:cytochrome o ubiquinol oxidase operon protein cyoD
MNTHNYFEEIGVLPRGAGKVFHAYLIGYALSLGLTLVAFVLTILHVFPYDDALVVLVILALIQFGVQAQCFLHLGSESASREKLMIFAGACLVILILVSGSLWIMFTLNSRQMPSEQQMEQYMNDQEGI